MIARLIAWSARNLLLVFFGAGFAAAAGIYALAHLPLDAIPDLSDTQVIVYTEYPGQAPQVIEDLSIAQSTAAPKDRATTRKIQHFISNLQPGAVEETSQSSSEIRTNVMLALIHLSSFLLVLRSYIRSLER